MVQLGRARVVGTAVAAGALLASAGCAVGPRSVSAPSFHPRGYVGCRTRTCTGGDPRHRQYFDQRRARYYWFDPARKRYYWEDGSPYP